MTICSQAICCSTSTDLNTSNSPFLKTKIAFFGFVQIFQFFFSSQNSKLANPDYDSDWIVVPPQSWGQYFLPSGKFFTTKSRMTCICQQTARYFINYNANHSGASSICQAFNNESANIAVRFLVWM